MGSQWEKYREDHGGSTRVQRGSWGWISKGKWEKGCWQLRGERGDTRGAAAAGETSSWPGAGLLAGPESWPWEERENGTEILHKQRLGMQGKAVGQTHTA